MKQKKLLIPILVFLTMVFSLSLVLGAITPTSPSTAGSTVTGTWSFNWTVPQATLNNTLNCTLSTTGDGAFRFITNTSAAQTTWSASNNTALLTEAEDTTWTISCANTTATASATLVINIDNTNPTCSFSLDRDVVSYQDQVGTTVVDASSDTTDLTYNYTLWRSDNTISTSYSDSEPTFSGSDLDTIDEFKVSCIITDEASLSTACTNQSLMVKGTDGDEAGIIGGSQLGGMGDNTSLIVIIAVVSVVFIGGIVVILVLSGKKKRR